MSLVEAVAASAACTLVAVVIFTWLWRKIQNRWVRKNGDSFRREEMGFTREEFKKLGKNIKGVIVEEHGVDVLYMRKLEDGRLTDVFTTVVMNPSYEQHGDEDEEKRVDEDGVLIEEMAESTSAPATLPPLLPPRAAYLPPPDPALILTSSLQPPPPSQPPWPSSFNKKSYCFGNSATTIIR